MFFISWLNNNWVSNILKNYETFWLLNELKRSKFGRKYSIMDIQTLDKELTQIAELRSALKSASQEQGNIKETLQNLEEKFLESYGNVLEDALKDVHDEICPDDQVKPVSSYLANSYIDTGNRRDGLKVFEVESNQGVEVGVDDYPGEDTKLVIIPNPCRIMLLVGENEREELWRIREN